MTLNRRTLLILLASCLPFAWGGCQTAPIVDDGGYEIGFQERSRILSDQVAHAYKPTDYTDRGKYTFPVVIARMDRYGPEDKRALEYLGEYADGKYGFFHFPFVGLARIICRYPDAEVVVKNREAFLREILFHDPLYHYNALTGEGTENHISMSRTSGYIFAQEAMRYPELRERASEWEPVLRKWILDWAHRIYAYGTGEWDSNPYTTYNLVGWLNLYDYAENEEVRHAARAVLDYYAANMALKISQGLLGGPESRGSSKYGPLPRSATEYLAWIWFGRTEFAESDSFFARSEYIQAMHGITSSYRPPVALQALARKKIPTPALYLNNKPDYLLLEKGQSREVFLIDEAFTLGTAMTPYGGWSNLSYGIINWKLVMMDPDGLPAIVIGNGGMKSPKKERGRNPFDQFTQYRNIVIQMTRVPANAESMAEDIGARFAEWKEKARDDFRARWGRPHHFGDKHISDDGRGSLDTAGLSILHVPSDIQQQVKGTTAFLQHGKTLLAATTLSGKPPVFDGDRIIDSAERDHMAGFVVEVVNSGEFDSLDAFASSFDSSERLQQADDGSSFTYSSHEDDTIEFAYANEGSWQELIIDWGYGVREKRVGYNTPDWKQADWPSGEGHGRIPSLLVNGEPVPHSGPDTIINGPYLKLHDRVLEISDPDGNFYRVDYTNSVPEFTSKLH